MLPVYSASQNDTIKLKQMLRRSMIMSSYVLFPIIAGLCVTAESIILIVLTDKWLPSVPFLIVLSLTYLLTPLQTANQQVIAAMGRSDIFLKMEILKKTLGTIVLVLSVVLFNDAIYVAYGGLLLAVLSSIINMAPNTKLIKYSYKEQVLDLLPNIFSSVIMAVIVWSISLLIHNNYVLIILQVMLGVGVYFLLTIVTRNPALKYILGIFKK